MTVRELGNPKQNHCVSAASCCFKDICTAGCRSLHDSDLRQIPTTQRGNSVQHECGSKEAGVVLVCMGTYLLQCDFFQGSNYKDVMIICLPRVTSVLLIRRISVSSIISVQLSVKTSKTNELSHFKHSLPLRFQHLNSFSLSKTIKLTEFDTVVSAESIHLFD